MTLSLVELSAGAAEFADWTLYGSVAVLAGRMVICPEGSQPDWQEVCADFQASFDGKVSALEAFVIAGMCAVASPVVSEPNFVDEVVLLHWLALGGVVPAPVEFVHDSEENCADLPVDSFDVVLQSRPQQMCRDFPDHEYPQTCEPRL